MELYETLNYPDINFPVIYHYDTFKSEKDVFCMHCHESIELLSFTNGTAEITMDGEKFQVTAGDIVIINSNKLHHIRSLSEKSNCHCLIPNKILTDSFEFISPDMIFKQIIHDDDLGQCFYKIENEFIHRHCGYEKAVLLYIEFIFLQLFRYYLSESNTSKAGFKTDKKYEFIKAAVSYMQNNFSKNITLDDISENVSLSKSYLCHIFKQLTGKKMIEMLNEIRCRNAQKLILSGRYNITESATSSGFDNLSYFSKTYKSVIGHLPSDDIRKSHN